MRVLVFLCLVLGVAACSESSPILATPESIAAVSYRDEGPSKLTVITMVNNETGAGGHTALMIAKMHGRSDIEVLLKKAGARY